MEKTFEEYLLKIGIRSKEYTYNDEELYENIEYFKKCYDDQLSAYKALLFLDCRINTNSVDNDGDECGEIK